MFGLESCWRRGSNLRILKGKVKSSQKSQKRPSRLICEQICGIIYHLCNILDDRNTKSWSLRLRKRSKKSNFLKNGITRRTHLGIKSESLSWGFWQTSPSSKYSPLTLLFIKIFYLGTKHKKWMTILTCESTLKTTTSFSLLKLSTLTPITKWSFSFIEVDSVQTLKKVMISFLNA